MTNNTVPITVSQLRIDSRTAVELMAERLMLPAPSMDVRHDVVHVTVADPDDLAEWLHELGGEIHRSPQHEGVALWTLHTLSPVRGDGTQVPILVHAVVVDAGGVLPEVRAAVAA